MPQLPLVPILLLLPSLLQLLLLQCLSLLQLLLFQCLTLLQLLLLHGLVLHQQVGRQVLPLDLALL